MLPVVQTPLIDWEERKAQVGDPERRSIAPRAGARSRSGAVGPLLAIRYPKPSEHLGTFLFAVVWGLWA